MFAIKLIYYHLFLFEIKRTAINFSNFTTRVHFSHLIVIEDSKRCKMKITGVVSRIVEKKAYAEEIETF